MLKMALAIVKKVIIFLSKTVVGVAIGIALTVVMDIIVHRVLFPIGEFVEDVLHAVFAKKRIYVKRNVREVTK